MQAKIVPWWRRALEFALGGIRTGFGLFSRHAQPEPAAPFKENSLIDKPEESLEVETVLTEQPNPETLPAAAETTAAPTPDAESIAKSAATPIPAPEIVTELQVADAIDPIDPVHQIEETGSADEHTVEAYEEIVPVASNAPSTELTVAAAIEPTPELEQEIAPQAEPETELDIQAEPAIQPEPESENVAEIVSEADPLPAAEAAPIPEPTPSVENSNSQAPDPLPEQSIEPVPEEVELASDLTEQLSEQPVAGPEPISHYTSSNALEAEIPVAAATEPAPITEIPPPTPKPFIKLETRDDEANLSPFSVVVEQVYDGPLDLLLDLIRKQDIDIYDIPIATITAQFLAYVNQLKASDVDVAGDFIYIASLLILIKS